MERAPSPWMLVIVVPMPRLDERMLSEEPIRLPKGFDEEEFDADAIAVNTTLPANFDWNFIAINFVVVCASSISSAPKPFIPNGPEALEFKPLRSVVVVLLFQSLSSDAVIDVFLFWTFDEPSLNGNVNPSNNRESAIGYVVPAPMPKLPLDWFR